MAVDPNIARLVTETHNGVGALVVTNGPRHVEVVGYLKALTALQQQELAQDSQVDVDAIVSGVTEGVQAAIRAEVREAVQAALGADNKEQADAILAGLAERLAS